MNPPFDFDELGCPPSSPGIVIGLFNSAPASTSWFAEEGLVSIECFFFEFIFFLLFFLVLFAYPFFQA